MTPDKRNPGALAGATGASEGVQHGGWNDLQNTPSPRTLQVRHLQCRYGIDGPRAHLIAALAFGSQEAA
ncbi:MAG: hypothetical protein WD341_19550 [Tistlia sp.]|uniref:hypothetical protein n=1 Tax=Tistlia sp. TaxID=3057121 RepID=UPI0034A23B8E